MPPRIAGFGNLDRFELNGKIALHRAAGQQCIGNAASGSMLHSVAAFHCNQPEHKKHKESLFRSSILLGVEKGLQPPPPTSSPALKPSRRSKWT
jgi:hypothetical protein